MTREEYKRCCDSPAYFINNYVLVKDAMGNFVKPEPVTDEQLNEAAEKSQKEYRKRLDYHKWQRMYAAMNLFPDTFRGQKIYIAINKEL